MRALSFTVVLASLGPLAPAPAHAGVQPSPAAPASAALVATASISTASSRTLRAGGMRIRAPRGYSLARRSGAFTLTGRTAKVSLFAVRTTDSVRSVAEGLLGLNLVAFGDGDRLALRPTLKGGAIGHAFFEKAPGGVSVVMVSPRGDRKSVSRRVLRTLGAAVRTARGVPLRSLDRTTVKTEEPAIALKAFQAADGSATAQVPDAPGWTSSGRQGIIEGGHPELGGYAFGVAATFQVPGAFCSNPCPIPQVAFMGSQQAVEQAWPVFLKSAGFQVGDIRVESLIPGSAGVLGPGIDSGIYRFAGRLGGLDTVGFISAGTFRVSAESWVLYYSFVAAARNASGAVGEAMFKAWQSWDPSADQARRQRQTFITRQETADIIQQTTEYRRRVFEATNYNWNQLVSGSNPVLGPVVRDVVGPGGETIVRSPEGGLFDLAGNAVRG